MSRPGRPARRLGHDRPPRHRVAGPARAASPRCTAAPPRSAGRSTDEPGFAAKSALRAAEKAAIARRRPRLVEPGASVALSAGTTTYAVAHAAARRCPDLTVVTNSSPVADAAARVRPRRPDRRAHRRRPHAVRRAGRPGGRRRAAHACTSTALPRRARHGRAGRAHHARTWSRPRPTGRWSPARRRVVVVADHTKWGVVGLSHASPRCTRSTSSSPTRAARRRAPERSRCSPSASARVVTGADADRGSPVTARHRRGCRRTRAHLADGREIIYFDDTEPYAVRRAQTRDLPDTRDLASPTRGRPDALRPAHRRVGRDRLAPAGPHLPAAGRRVPAVPDRPRHRAVGDPGRRLRRRRVREPLPVLRRPASPDVGRTWSTASRCGRSGPAIGRCEVVCFTSDHDASFADLSPERVRTVVEAWVDRTERARRASPAVEQVFCFENRGEEIGVTLHHPHGQIYALPVRHAAHRTRCSSRPRAAPRAHRRATCSRDVLDAELADGHAGRAAAASTGRPTSRPPRAGRSRCTSPRTATSPTCPRWTTPSATSSPHVYLDAAAAARPVYSTTACRSLPYIAGWHQAPVRDRPRPRLGCTCSCSRCCARPGKLKYLAGSESGMGAWVNDIAARADRGTAARGRADPRRRLAADPRPDERRRRAGSSRRSSRVRRRAGRRLVGARPGQPDRRAHRLQRRPAACRSRSPHRTYVALAARRRRGGCGCAPCRRHGRRRLRGRTGRHRTRAARRLGRRTSAGVAWALRGRPGTTCPAWTSLVDGHVPLGVRAVVVARARVRGRARARRAGRARARRRRRAAGPRWPPLACARRTRSRGADRGDGPGRVAALHRRARAAARLPRLQRRAGAVRPRRPTGSRCW